MALPPQPQTTLLDKASVQGPREGRKYLMAIEWVRWLLSVKDVVDALRPQHLANSAVNNDSIYYSTDASKLVYKDSDGNVHNLY